MKNNEIAILLTFTVVFGAFAGLGLANHYSVESARKKVFMNRLINYRMALEKKINSCRDVRKPTTVCSRKDIDNLSTYIKQAKSFDAKADEIIKKSRRRK